MYLQLENISKKIKNDVVLQDISLGMDTHRIYGIQGRNGCGKSMLMRVICGLVLPTTGSVTINGKKLGEEISFPTSAGALIEHPGFFGTYSGLDNLKVLASIQRKIGEEEIKETLIRVGMEENMKKKYKKYSLGMKQKLGIAASIMETPELIILDEPSNGLDEKSEENLWQILKEEKERGALVIISCHDREVLEGVSDEIYMMDRGRIKEHVTLNKGDKESIGV